VHDEDYSSSSAWRCNVAKIPASKFHQIPDALWKRMEPLLPKYKVSPKGGKPRLALRSVANGIFYVLVTGCQWKAMPREFGSGSAIHAYFQEWVAAGVFEKLWRIALEEYDDLKGIDWEWQSLDGAMNKSPLGGEKNREKPDGSWQAWRETFGADRRPWSAARSGGGRRKCA
jgi:transposase